MKHNNGLEYFVQDVIVTLLEGETMTIRFADDVVLIVSADNKGMLIRRVNKNLRKTHKWMKENELNLVSEKTEAFFIYGKRKRRDVIFKIGYVHTVPQKSVIYLQCSSRCRATITCILRKLQQEQKK